MIPSARRPERAGTFTQAVPLTGLPSAESLTTAKAPFFIAASMNWLPSLVPPRIATKQSPDSIFRESKFNPDTSVSGFEIDMTSAPSSISDNLIFPIIRVIKITQAAKDPIHECLFGERYGQPGAGRHMFARARRLQTGHAATNHFDLDACIFGGFYRRAYRLSQKRGHRSFSAF